MRRFAGRSLFLAACFSLVGCSGESGSPDSRWGSNGDCCAIPNRQPEVASTIATPESSDEALPAADAGGLHRDFDVPAGRSGEADRHSALSEEPTALPTPKNESRSQPKAGTLTAGSLDDQNNYDEFIEYVRNAMQTGRQLPQFAQQLQHRRALIQIQDAQGKPIGDATVKVFATEPDQSQAQAPVQSKYQSASQTQSLITLTTGSDGKTMFLPQLDAGLAGSSTEFELEITVQDQTIRQTVSMNQSPWVVKMDDVVAQLPRQLDLASIIDTTGSMDDELDYLKVEIDSIAQKVKSLYPHVDQRFAVVLYRDNGDEYVTRSFDFTTSLGEFRSTLAKQSARGGGDDPEALDAGLEQATQLSWRQGDTARVAFVVGDAPPHASDFARTFSAINKLRQQDVALYPIAASGSDDQAEFILRTASFLTLGKYLFLTDHSGVGNAHATPDAPRYNVERLDQLMVRMIASELAGQEVLAEDIIATERKNATAAAQEQLQTQSNAQQNQNIAIPQLPSTTSTSLGSVSEAQVRFALVMCCVIGLVVIHAQAKKAKIKSWRF